MSWLSIVFVTFPPKRPDVSVATIAKCSLMIGCKKLVDSQFPVQIGYIFVGSKQKFV